MRPGIVQLEAGHIAGIAAAFSNAASVILVRLLGKTERSVVLVLYPQLAMTLGMGLLLPFVYVPMEFSALAAMGLVGWIAVLAQTLIVNSYRFAPATIVAPMQYSQMIWAVIFGATLFSEFPDFWTIVGSVIIVASGIYIVWRESLGSRLEPVSRAPNLRPDAGPVPGQPSYRDGERIRGS